MKKNKSFRESGRGESVGFFRVLGLTIIIVAVVFLITLTSSSERQEETTTGSQAPTQTTPVTETTPIRTTTESAPIITTTTIPPQTTTAPSLVPTNKEMKKLIEEKYLPINPHSRVGELRIATKQIVIHYVANAGSSAETTGNISRIPASTQAQISSSVLTAKSSSACR